MALKIFNGSVKQNRVVRATVNFHISGKINFSSGAVIRMGMKQGDKLIFAQDEQEPENWYVRIAGSDEQGYEAKPGAANNKYALIIHSKDLVYRMYHTIQNEQQTSTTMLIGLKPEEINGSEEKWWPIITASAHKTQRS